MSNEDTNEMGLEFKMDSISVTTVNNSSYVNFACPIALRRHRLVMPIKHSNMPPPTRGLSLGYESIQCLVLLDVLIRRG